MKTTAAILRNHHDPVALEELTVPALKPGQVLVKVAFSGLCRTQLMEIQGRKGPDRFLPHTLGHEGSGIVIDIGARVEKVRVGDRVVLSWVKGNGINVPSTTYKGSWGAVNSGSVSTLLSHAVVSESCVTPIPEWMPMQEAALLGCAALTGAGMVFNTLNIQSGETLAIFGVGGIGLSALLAAQAVGARIIAVDRSNVTLHFAKKLGAGEIINVPEQDPVSVIRMLTNEKGVDYAIECAGQKEAMEMAFEAVREGGGTCVLAGNLPHGEKISLDPFALIKGKHICGTWAGESALDADVPRLISLYHNKRLPLHELITEVFPLSEVNKGFQKLNDGVVGRLMVELSPSEDECTSLQR